MVQVFARRKSGLFIHFLVWISFVTYVNSDTKTRLRQARQLHEARDLTDADVGHLASLADEGHLNGILDNILVPRVVGTPGHTQVGDYIVGEMRNLGWDVEEDRFQDHTPIFGQLQFRNIIAKLNPDAERFLIIACHYDSKYMREHNFVGAMDSAVPCAMMLNLAKTMKPLLDKTKSRIDVSLALLFFDGEEAFREWNAQDSIYGARHLAKKWEHQHYPKRNSDANHLDRIDLLILLDLLGTPDPAFYSYFSDTEKWYVRLANAEDRLSELNQFQKYSSGKSGQRYFRLRSSNSYIEDDHIPFLQRNVPIVHLIPSPFPAVWHKPSDDRSALDMNTIENLNKILRVFIAEYLNIAVSEESPGVNQVETAGQEQQNYAPDNRITAVTITCLLLLIIKFYYLRS